MNDLEKLLSRAFENKAGNRSYKQGPWSITFEKRTWETLFWLYKDGVEKASGTTRDKTFEYSQPSDRETNNCIQAAMASQLPAFHATNADISADLSQEDMDAIDEAVSKLYYVETDEHGGKFIELFADYYETNRDLLPVAYEHRNDGFALDDPDLAKNALMDAVLEAIDEQYEPSIFDAEDNIMREAGFDPSDDMASRQIDYLREHYSFVPPYDHFLKQDMKVNLLFATDYEMNRECCCLHEQFEQGICEGDEEELHADTALTWLVKQQGYTMEELRDTYKAYRDFLDTHYHPNGAPKEGEQVFSRLEKALAAFTKEYSPTNSTFLTSMCQEMENQTYYAGAMTVLAKMDMYQFAELLQKGKEAVFPKGAMVGIYDPWNGSGSVLEVELEKELVLPSEMITKIQIESVKPEYEWTVDSTYGLVGTAWEEIKAVRDRQSDRVPTLEEKIQNAASRSDANKSGPTKEAEQGR